jgi:flagellar hook-associated protein 3 FlgL
MRITDNMQLSQAIAGQETASTTLYNLSAEASSGKKIVNPSDSPAGYAQVVSTTAQIARMNARQTTIATATGDLTDADGALSSAGDLLTQAKTLALEAANGTQDATSRAETAQQIDQISNQLLALANTKGASGGYIFGGTANGTAPFDSSGTFKGNAQTTNIEVADGVTAQSNVSGADAFTIAGGTDVFAALSAFSTALKANDTTGINNAVSTMDQASSQVLAVRVSAGVLESRMQSASTVITNALTTSNTQLQSEQSADVATVYSELSAAQTSYQAAISVNSQILSTLNSRFS